jgi:hypothetical protein
LTAAVEENRSMKAAETTRQSGLGAAVCGDLQDM